MLRNLKGPLLERSGPCGQCQPLSAVSGPQPQHCPCHLVRPPVLLLSWVLAILFHLQVPPWRDAPGPSGDGHIWDHHHPGCGGLLTHGGSQILLPMYGTQGRCHQGEICLYHQRLWHIRKCVLRAREHGGYRSTLWFQMWSTEGRWKHYEVIAKAEGLKPLEVELWCLEDLLESIVNDFSSTKKWEEERCDIKELRTLEPALQQLFNALSPWTSH